MMFNFSTLRLRPHLSVLIGLLALILAQWIVFGFNWPDAIESWIRIGSIEQRPFLLLTDARPLTDLPWALAHALTPDSFLGVNIVLALSLLIKALALYALILELTPDHKALAYAVAALSIVYPADDATFNLTVMGINFAIAFLVVALWLLVAYWNRGGLWRLVTIWCALTLSLGIYEVGYPIVMCAPLLLLVQEKRFSRRMIRVLAAWYAVPLILLVRAFILVQLDQSGSGTLGYVATQRALDLAPLMMIQSLFKTYVWQLGTSWSNAVTLIGPLRLQSAHSIVVLSTVLVTILVVRRVSGLDQLRHNRRVLLVAGFVTIGLGFLAYLPSDLRDSIERTMIYGSVGAVMCVAGVINLLTHTSRWLRLGLAGLMLLLAVLILVESHGANRLAPLLMMTMALGWVLPERWRYALVIAGLVGLGTAFALNRHEKHIARALRQEPILTALTLAVPKAAPETVFLLFDAPESRELYDAFWWRNDVLNSAVRYLYAAPRLEAYVCLQDKSLLNTWMGSCELQPDGFTIAYPTQYQETVSRAYDRVVALRYSPESSFAVLRLDELPTDALITGYDPSSRIDSTAPPPPRLTTIFDHPPLDWQAMFKG